MLVQIFVKTMHYFSITNVSHELLKTKDLDVNRHIEETAILGIASFQA